LVWYSKLWVKISLVVIAVGLVVGGTYAYYWFSQPPAGPKVSIMSDPLEFSMELDKSDYQYGGNITIKFRLENIGNESITIMRSAPPGWPTQYMRTSYFGVETDPYYLNKEFFFGFRITHLNGTEIYEQVQGVLQYSFDFRMSPGGWIEQTITYDYYSTEWAGMGNSYLLPRDTYRVRGVFRHSVNNSPLYTLETPAIAFVIR